jgi:hypothetical protein
MDPVSIVTTILSLIPDLLSTRGGRLIAGKYIAGKYFSTIALNKINPIVQEQDTNELSRIHGCNS